MKNKNTYEENRHLSEKLKKCRSKSRDHLGKRTGEKKKQLKEKTGINWEKESSKEKLREKRKGQRLYKNFKQEMEAMKT